jgi:hypothetical protein
MFLGTSIPFDILFSPIAYYIGRDCVAIGTERRYVGTPEEIKQKQQEREEIARKERLAKQKLEEEAAVQKAEAEKIARDYPPLNDSPRADAPRPNDYALVVGIESYRSIPKADFGEDDAKSVKTYLQALGVPPQNVVLLTGQRASRADIAKYLEEWLPAVVKKNSRVYFYYSGHGAPEPKTGTAYLVPWDGDPLFLKSTAVSISKLYADLSALPAKESIVMLDSCFSGTGGRSVMAPGTRPLVLSRDAAAIPDRMTVLSASGAGEIAGSLDLRRHGLFTYYMLRGLAGEADANRDGHMTAGELLDYVRTQVGNTARRSNRDQTPRLLGNPSLRLY